MTQVMNHSHGVGRIRTAAVPELHDTLLHVGANDVMYSLHTCPALPDAPSAAAGLVATIRSLISVDLVTRAHLDACLRAVTSPPLVPSLTPKRAHPPKVVEAEAPMAKCAVAELKDTARLTNEEIAVLAGVSRRSVQAWITGGAISGPNEQHLRSVIEAVRELATPDAAGTRVRLFNRRPECVRPYDLLMEGRFQAAVAAAMGSKTAGRATPLPVSNLAAQFDHHENRVDVPERSLNRTLSGRPRR